MRILEAYHPVVKHVAAAAIEDQRSSAHVHRIPAILAGPGDDLRRRVRPSYRRRMAACYERALPAVVKRVDLAPEKHLAARSRQRLGLLDEARRGHGCDRHALRLEPVERGAARPEQAGDAFSP